MYNVEITNQFGYPEVEQLSQQVAKGESSLKSTIGSDYTQSACTAVTKTAKGSL